MRMHIGAIFHLFMAPNLGPSCGCPLQFLAVARFNPHLKHFAKLCHMSRHVRHRHEKHFPGGNCNWGCNLPVSMGQAIVQKPHPWQEELLDKSEVWGGGA